MREISAVFAWLARGAICRGISNPGAEGLNAVSGLSATRHVESDFSVHLLVSDSELDVVLAAIADTRRVCPTKARQANTKPIWRMSHDMKEVTQACRVMAANLKQ